MTLTGRNCTSNHEECLFPIGTKTLFFAGKAAFSAENLLQCRADYTAKLISHSCFEFVKKGMYMKGEEWAL
jgi:hypothetical protein